MRAHTLYASMQCIVHRAELNAADLIALEQCLRDGGAKLLEDVNTSSNSAVTHIVCHPNAYHAFVEQRNERFVALVRPEWVFRTFLLQRLLPVDRFSPNPALIFSTLAISAGTIGKDPRKVINGLITHFGGQIVDEEEVNQGATHILYHEDSSKETVRFPEPDEERESDQILFQLPVSSVNVDQSIGAWCQHLSSRAANSTHPLPSCLVAFIRQRAGLATQYHLKHSWIEQCVIQQRRVAEGPFVLMEDDTAAVKIENETRKIQLDDLNLSKCAQVYQVGKTELGAELSVVHKLSAEKLKAMKKTLQGTIVLLAQHIAPLLRQKLSDILKAVDAKVANVPIGDSYQEIVRKVVTNASFVVCRYRGGFEYNEAMHQKKTVVSIYWVLAGLSQVNKPTSFNEIIQRPVQSFGGIPRMQYLIVTLSGYSSRSTPTREELQIAIHATGACLLPVLSRTHSTHLVCYEATGEKYQKALSWGFNNVLSHEWVFACLSKWQHVAEDTFRYNSIKELSGNTDSTASNNSRQKKESAAVEEEIGSKTKLATTDSTRSAKNTRKVGQGRFDVDSTLNEIDKVPTPTDKKVPNDHMTSTPTTNSDRLSSAADRPNDVACTLFDTPTNPNYTSPKKRNSRTKDKASGGVEEVALAAMEVTKTDTEAKALQESSVLADKPDFIITGQETVISTNMSVKQSNTKKRKSKELEKGDTSKKKQKKKTTGSAEKEGGASALKTKRVFLLTGDRDQAAMHTSIISSLGASVSEFNRVYDSNCTHIICSELKRTEKFIAGCAAGKVSVEMRGKICTLLFHQLHRWILKPSFLNASAAAKKFVDEAEHEWGSHKMDSKEIDPRIWPEVCKYWREKRASGHPGAFAGWRFFIHAKSTPPRDMCERIVLAGGGCLVPLTKSADFESLAKTSTPDAPVVALFPPEVPARDLWLKKLKTHNIECLKASFLVDYITKKQTPPVKRTSYQI
ncbi:hypothetical protein PsorP6_003971 [Peronosclerospora sorghi]|uniref:Uncharacterized protein n=1 Tax=Peronosclerospora sorghi TaxID=230839 RepID=A0ACC0VKM5_9STRA|nr:hypothetical protein PsorP6_003971 [Peronosclerospora sorghi]